MDFQQLLAKMQELDRPTSQIAEQPIVTDEGGCGMDSPMAPPMSSMPPKPDEPPPSMSVNMNAQGMDNIEQLLKLITKVNPDMQKPEMPPMPSMSAPPSIMSIKPELPPLKMLPDMDSDYDMDGKLDPHEKDHAAEKPLLKSLDKDNDGDHDMDDHDAEKKKEAYANEPAEDEADIADITDTGDDLHRKKMMFKATAGGDNPMATEGTDLRSQIRAELLRRLEEAKGAK